MKSYRIACPIAAAAIVVGCLGTALAVSPAAAPAASSVATSVIYSGPSGSGMVNTPWG